VGLLAIAGLPCLRAAACENYFVDYIRLSSISELKVLETLRNDEAGELVNARYQPRLIVFVAAESV